MRSLAILVAVYFASGCSVLDQISFNSPPRLDPTRIYLGTSRITVGARDVKHYACVNGPLLCESFGISYDCRCPNAF